MFFITVTNHSTECIVEHLGWISQLAVEEGFYSFKNKKQKSTQNHGKNISILCDVSVLKSQSV